MSQWMPVLLTFFRKNKNLRWQVGQIWVKGYRVLPRTVNVISSWKRKTVLFDGRDEGMEGAVWCYYWSEFLADIFLLSFTKKTNFSLEWQDGERQRVEMRLLDCDHLPDCVTFGGRELNCSSVCGQISLQTRQSLSVCRLDWADVWTVSTYTGVVWLRSLYSCSKQS